MDRSRRGQGNLLTASYPKPDLKRWTGAGKEHLTSNPAALTAYAIGLKNVTVRTS